MKISKPYKKYIIKSIITNDYRQRKTEEMMFYKPYSILSSDSNEISFPDT